MKLKNPIFYCALFCSVFSGYGCSVSKPNFEDGDYKMIQSEAGYQLTFKDTPVLAIRLFNDRYSITAYGPDGFMTFTGQFEVGKDGPLEAIRFVGDSTQTKVIAYDETGEISHREVMGARPATKRPGVIGEPQ